MDPRRKSKLFLVTASLGIVTLVLILASMIGFFRDREFSSLHVFIKHRPSSILYFSSPIGEGNLPSGGLASPEAEREDEFVEFVEDGGGYRRSAQISY
jgi:hypothetical protein